MEPVFPLLSVHSAQASDQGVFTSIVSVPVFVVTTTACIFCARVVLLVVPVLNTLIY